MCPSADPDARRFFGGLEPGRKASWKLQQLCRQAERAASMALAEECECDALAGAVVADVVPAPDGGRLMVVVALAGDRTAERAGLARAALALRVGAFRREVARAIHRKRVPALVFDVRWMEEVDRA